MIRVYRHGPGRGRRPPRRGGPAGNTPRAPRRVVVRACSSRVLFLTDDKTTARLSSAQECNFFFSVVKRAKTGFSSTRKTVSSRPLRERRVTHGTVDTQHHKLQPSIVVEPSLAMWGPRWPMSHKYSKPPGRWQREIALGRGTITDL